MVFIAGMGGMCAQGLDSLRKVELADRLEEYFEALKYETIDVQKEECEYLIKTASDQDVRDFIAQTIYSHYIDSKIMGAEAVAIHLTDNWFLPGKVSFRNDDELFAARIFAEFNRQSQIGSKAPELSMETIDGRAVSLFSTDDTGSGFKVLYFYDADCVNCRLETILLGNVLETEDFPVTFYAIYVGDDRNEWEEYVKDRLSLDTVNAKVIHLWDPDLESDFQRKYGILQTPRLFLVAPDGTIIGRGLDAQALSQMLHGLFDEVELEYGSDESAELFRNIFPSGRPTPDEVVAIADYITATTLPKGDTLMFRQLTGDMLYYLATTPGEGFKEGLGYLIDQNIASRHEIWNSQSDSLKILGFADIMSDLLSKSRPGTRISDVAVPGELKTYKKSRPVNMKLSKLNGERNIIIFYTEGCNNCKAEKEAADALLQLAESDDDSVARAARKTKILLVNTDEIMRKNPALASRLFDIFDLSTLPYIITTDKNRIITHRYFSLL